MQFYLLNPVPTSLYPGTLENPLAGFQVNLTSFNTSPPIPLFPVNDLAAGIADVNIVNLEYTGRFSISNEFLPYLRFQRSTFITVEVGFSDEEYQTVFPGYTATISTNLGNITQSVEPIELEDYESVPPINVPLGGTSVDFLPNRFTLADVLPAANTTFSFFNITIRDCNGRQLHSEVKQGPKTNPAAIAAGSLDGRDETGRIILKTAGGGTAYLSEPVPVARYAGVPIARTGKVAL